MARNWDVKPSRGKQVGGLAKGRVRIEQPDNPGVGRPLRLTLVDEETSEEFEWRGPLKNWRERTPKTHANYHAGGGA